MTRDELWDALKKHAKEQRQEKIKANLEQANQILERFDGKISGIQWEFIPLKGIICHDKEGIIQEAPLNKDLEAMSFVPQMLAIIKELVGMIELQQESVQKIRMLLGTAYHKMEIYKNTDCDVKYRDGKLSIPDELYYRYKGLKEALAELEGGE